MALTIQRKSETLTLRVSGRTKLAIELLAQKEGTTLSAIVMEAMEQPIKDGLTVFKEAPNGTQERVFLPDVIYDPLEPDQEVKLAVYAPELLTDRQRVVWKVITEDRKYSTKKGDPNISAIRGDWLKIQRTADQLTKAHG